MGPFLGLRLLAGPSSHTPLLMIIISEANKQQQSVEETRLPKLSHVHVWLILYVGGVCVWLGERRTSWNADQYWGAQWPASVSGRLLTS